MKEIGGFLEWETYDGEELHNNCIALNSGRNCLRYLIKTKGIKKIWLPKLLCSVISDTCQEENVDILYYSVNKQLRPEIAESINKDEWLYLINYYGQYNDLEIKKYAEKYKNVIMDNAHAMYEEPVLGIDTIYTCRKYFGVPDGGYLYTNTQSDIVIEQDESYDRIEFLMGRFEKSANEFYKDYRKNEERIDKLPLKRMSKSTHNLLRGINYSKVKDIRERNFYYLHQKLCKLNELELRIPVGAYMYPLYINNGHKLRLILQRNKIFIPLLWPNVISDLSPDKLEYKLAENILPLPCDHRYNIKDMQYMIDLIEKIIMEDKLV